MSEELSKGHVGQEILLVSPGATVGSARCPPLPASVETPFSKQIEGESPSQCILPDIDITDSK